MFQFVFGYKIFECSLYSQNSPVCGHHISISWLWQHHWNRDSVKDTPERKFTKVIPKRKTIDIMKLAGIDRKESKSWGHLQPTTCSLISNVLCSLGSRVMNGESEEWWNNADLICVLASLTCGYFYNRNFVSRMHHGRFLSTPLHRDMSWIGVVSRSWIGAIIRFITNAPIEICHKDIGIPSRWISVIIFG